MTEKTIYIVTEQGPDKPYRFISDTREEAEKLVEALKKNWKNLEKNLVPERKHTIEEYLLVDRP